MTHRERVMLLREAVELENAGGTWTQKHAAVVTGYSVSFLRNSTCPKRYEEGEGPKARPRLVYVPSEVRAWKASRQIRPAAPTERAS